MSCPDCFRGSIHEHKTPTGKMQDLHGVKTYVALPPNNPSPKSTIIFYTDAFGLELPNNKILSDTYATSTGCRVLTPDIIPGGPAPLYTMHAMNEVFKPIGDTWGPYLNPLTWVRKGWATSQLIFRFVPFLIFQGPDKGYAPSLKYAQAVRASLPADAKLGVAGFCWGGYQSTYIIKEARNDGSGKALVDVSFSAHPSGLAPPDDIVEAIGKFKVPYSCAVAEFDFQFNKEVSEKCEAAVRQKLGEGVGNYEFVVHEGMHHGFAVRASPDEGIMGDNGYNGAAKQAVNWFNKYMN